VSNIVCQILKNKKFGLYLFERWQETALLFFQRWLMRLGKINVLFVRLAFQHGF